MRLYPSWGVVLASWLLIANERASSQNVGARINWELQRDTYTFGTSDAARLSPSPGIVRSQAGIIAAAQPQENLIRLFNPQGHFIRAVGGDYSLQGSISRISGLGFVGDTLWVADGYLGRFALFTLDEHSVRYVSLTSLMRGLSAQDKSAYWIPEAVLSHGTALVTKRTQLGATSAMLRTELFLVSAPDQAPASLVVLNQDSSAVPIQGERGVRQFRNRFVQKDLFAVQSDGSHIVTATFPFRSSVSAQAVDVTVYSSEGDTLFRRRVTVAREPITQGDVNRAVALYESPSPVSTYGPPVAPERDTRLLETVRKIAGGSVFYPAVSKLLLSQDGMVWLRTSTKDEGERWLVLRANGLPDAEVRLPPQRERTVAAVNGMSVWTLERDEATMGSRIVPYRIVLRAR